MTWPDVRSPMERIALLIVICIAVMVSGWPSEAAPKAELWPKWQTHDPDATTTLDHSAWDRFLSAYLTVGTDGVARIRYGKVTPDDRALLSEYIEKLSTVTVGALARPTQMAFWINLYNALTVAVVLDHYPVETILDIDISPGLFSNGPWRKKLVTVEGERLSLDDIEHRILRPIWRDPRIHYVVNCASVGCPNLASRAYDVDRLEDMLNAAARSFVNHARGISFEGREVIASKLYEWYRVDFGKNDRDVLRHLGRFAAPELRERLAKVNKIDRHRYDWQLNDDVTPVKPKMDMEDQHESR